MINMQQAFTFDLPDQPQLPVAKLIVPHLHRLPPKPPWLYAYFREHQKTRWGHCNWCGEGIHPGQRKNPSRCTWHLECLSEYNLLFNWQHTRKVVMGRDKRICQSCGLGWYEVEPDGEGVRMHVDHILPLHQWPARDLAALTQGSFMEWYAPWLPSNLQTLCVSCHKAKTANERRVAA